MPRSTCAPCDPQATDGVNPLLVLVFCPHCFFTGVFAAAAAGAISLPAVFGIGLEWLIPPILIPSAFVGWVWWGYRDRAENLARADRGDVASPQAASNVAR